MNLVRKILRKLFSGIKINYIKLFYRNRIRIGNNSLIDLNTSVTVHPNGKIKIGNGVLLRSNKNGYHAGMPFSTTLLLDTENACLQIEHGVKINGAYIHAQKEIVIGKNSVIASGVNIIDSNGHQTISHNRTLERDKPRSIFIGENVWIGLNSIILKGTKIGNNSIIGAGSVVQGIFPENVIIKGNPAVVVKEIRYEENPVTM